MIYYKKIAHMCCSIIIFTNAYAYRKFSYVTHKYPSDTQETLTAFNTIMNSKLPFKANAIDYAFSYNDDTVQCYVTLSRKDRGNLLEYLATYSDPALKISDPILRDRLLQNSNQNRYIGLMLDDFVSYDPEATIYDVQEYLRQ